MTTQQEIEALYERLEELDNQAFLNFVETQEIVSRLKELGRLTKLLVFWKLSWKRIPFLIMLLVLGRLLQTTGNSHKKR